MKVGRCLSLYCFHCRLPLWVPIWASVVCGLENDVYFQIGLVMLVGLAAKNAILIVEFAKVQVDKGGDLIQSAIHAAQLRFRPILMTSLAFVLGMLPMVLASGPGSASRQAIGTGVFLRNDICHCIRYRACAVLLCPGVQDKSKSAA